MLNYLSDNVLKNIGNNVSIAGWCDYCLSVLLTY